MNTAQANSNSWFDISAAALFAEIGATRQADYDLLPFGAIALAPDGKVVTYNAAESAFSGLNAANVIGRDFFRDIAPCARVRDFGGVIESAEPGSTIDTSLVFTFRFVQGWRQAKIRIVRNADVSPLTFIFVSPLGMVNSTRTRSKIAPGKPN